MVPNYRTIQVSATSGEDLIPKIYEILQTEGYITPIFTLKFVGFEMTGGTEFQLNGKNIKVPSNGIFISPYQSDNDCLLIRSLIFNQGINNMNFWIIY